MIPLPKPRGFWDYALFALAMTGALVLLFWLEASDGVGWADAVLAVVASVLLVLGIILVRRGENATWIARPSWSVHLLVRLGVFVLIFGAIYADAYLLHRTDITSKRLRDEAILAIVLTAETLWSLRRRRSAGHQLS
jgi:hypothetical protein